MLTGTEARLPSGGPVLTDPVTWEGFSAFLRAGAYFEPGNWPPGCPRPRTGGDRILRRIGFSWKRRHLPVTRVRWAEAWAYCRHRKGRLPFFDEYAELDAAIAGKARRWTLAGLFFGERRSGSPPQRKDPEPGLLFWCAEWYHPCWSGETVKMPFGSPPTRRLYPVLDHGVLGEVVRDDIGFRVALPASVGVAAVSGARA